MKLRHTPIGIRCGDDWLDGELAHAPDVHGLALILAPELPPPDPDQPTLAHALQAQGYATLALRLLTPYEQARDPDARYNVPQLTQRVLAASTWIGHQPPLTGLPVGLVAQDTACAAAIRAAVAAPQAFGAIVCLGGRADLAGAGQLRALAVPIRFVLARGDAQQAMLEPAYALIGATRDWQELADDTADTVAAGTMAADWLQRWLAAPAATPATPIETPQLQGGA